MALLYPFLVTKEGIKTNVLGKDIFFRFIVPPVLKEKHSSKKVTILTDINERGIYRAETSLSSLKTQILLVDQMTENDKKKAKQDKETEICSYSLETCSYSPIAFLRKYQHKVQSPHAEELSTKGIKDGNMDVIFCSQYAWTESMIEVPKKIIINDIFTPFTVSLNTHLTDILRKEALTDSPLFIIKESSNCGNFLNNDRFNFLIDRINYNPLTKGIKDRNMDVIFCSQYAWTDSMIEVTNKIIINDIFTPFTVSINTHLTDILIKEALTDSPLFIIKQSSNCGNFLNNDRFNFLTLYYCYALSWVVNGIRAMDGRCTSFISLQLRSY